ncbi:ATP-dependent helicase/deoxyribonuclease subunit B [subsurface metagenome]
MNLSVFTGPDTNENLKSLLKQTPLGSGPLCVVVPDSRSVSAFQKQLISLSGGAYIVHKVFTLEGLASAVIDHSANPPDIIREHVKKSLIGEIVKSRIKEHSKYYTIAAYPGFKNSISSLLEDIRSSGDNTLTINTELVEIAAAYESHLGRLGLTDHEGIVKFALEKEYAERFGASFNGSLIVNGFYDLTDCQYALFERLFRVFGRSSVALVNDPSRPDLFALPGRLLEKYRSLNARIIEVPGSDTPGPDRILCGFGGGEYENIGEKENVLIHTFRSVQSEADWIAGTIRDKILNESCEPGDIMVVSRHSVTYPSHFEKALSRHGIPVENGIPRQFDAHPLVKLSLDALRISIHPDDEDVISGIQQSSYTGDGSYVPFDRKLAVNADDRAWSCMIAEIDSPEGYVSSFKRMLGWLGIEKNLDGCGNSDAAHYEKMVYERLIELLDEFAAFYGKFRKMMKAVEFNRLIRDFIGSVRIPDRINPNRGIVVADVNHARFIKRDIVFIMGLDDSSFPVRDRQFSLHGDSSSLKYSEHRKLEEPLLFYLSASGARKLYLTYPGIDNELKDDTMSPYLREIRNVLGDPTPPHAGVAGAAWEDGAFLERGQNEQLMRMVKRDFGKAAETLSAIGKVNRASYDRIEKAAELYTARIEDSGTDLSTVPAFVSTTDKTLANRDFSVTELETYLTCPMKHFLSYGLGLTVEIKVTDEIDPRVKGQLIHDILARFYTMRKEKYGRTVFTRDELPECIELLHGIIEKAFTKAGRETAGLHPVILIAEKKFVRTWMEVFLKKEPLYFEESGFEPVGFEIAFGSDYGKMKPDFPALELENDDTRARIRGRIDRIDLRKDADRTAVRVIDYKTGKTDIRNKDIPEGKALQIPIYLDASVKNIIPEGDLYDGLFYSLKDMELKGYKINRCPIEGQDWEEHIATARASALTVIHRITEGCYPLPDEKCEEYCDFISLCRGGVTKPEGGA